MPFQPLYKNIFDQNESDAGAAVLLQQVTRDHPYFSLAHFFLLKHAGIKDTGYAKIAAKTALHFNNAFWLQSQLHEEPPFAESDILPAPTANAEVLLELIIEEEVPVISNDAEPVAQESDEAEVTETSTEQEDLQQEKILEESVLSGEAANFIKAPLEDKELAAAIPIYKTADTNPSSTKLPSLAAAKPGVEGTLLFTPLYATDYFASQGIKLREEAQPNDKLGKQLKSFTDWLKTMKKVHESKLPAGSEVLDLSVQNLAEKSNKGEQVITESMAEVFLQQGKLHKAKEIYEKLSLLDPSKIAYFAAKIDQIQQK